MNRSLMVLCALCLMFANVCARAQTFQHAESTGHFDVGYGNTVINVNVLRGIYPDVAPYPFISIQGTVGIVTNSWRVSGNVQSVTFSWQYSFGQFVPHAVLVSKSATLTYFVAPYGSKPAHVIVTLTQWGAHGQGGFQVISDDVLAGDAGKILFQSQWMGRYAEYSFTVGGVTITE